MFKILIVDDHQSFRETLKAYLSHELSWVILEEAANTKEAIEKVALFRPDLIFMDIHLPEGSGLELMKKILPNYPNTKVIIMTGYELTVYQELAAQYGAVGFFSKGEATGRDILAFVKAFQPVRGSGG